MMLFYSFWQSWLQPNQVSGRETLMEGDAAVLLVHILKDTEPTPRAASKINTLNQSLGDY